MVLRGIISIFHILIVIIHCKWQRPNNLVLIRPKVFPEQGDAYTPVWQLSTLPKLPLCWQVTPTDCLPTLALEGSLMLRHCYK